MKSSLPALSSFHPHYCRVPRRQRRLAQAAIALVALAAASAQATQRSWSYAAGCADLDFMSTCWTTDGTTLSAPVAGDDLKLNWSGDLTPNAVLFAKLAAPAMPAFGTLDISGGTFGSQGKLGPQVLRLERNTLQTTRTRIGFATGTSAEVSVAGVLDQTGGSHLTGSLLMGADGHYILRGGTLNAGSVAGFDASSFTMDGGMLNLSGAMAVGRLDLSGGQFSFTGPSVTAGALNMGLKLNPSPDPVQLRVGAGQSVEVTGLLKVGVLTPGTLIVDAGGRLYSQEALLGELPPETGGFVKLPGGIGSVRVAGTDARWRNDGQLVLGGSASGPGGHGALTVADRGKVSVGGSLHLWRGGSLLVESGASIAAGALVAERDSLVTLRNGTLSVTAGAQVQGKLIVSAGDANRIDGPVVWMEGARLEVQALLGFGGPVTFEAGAHIHNDGEIYFNGRTVLQPGVGLSGQGAKYFFGSVVLGDDFAQIVDSNALALMPGSVLEVDLGAPVSGVRYASQSWVFLGGGLKLSPVNGYSGRAGDRYTLLGAGGGFGGNFTQIDTSGFALAPGLRWDFTQLDSAGIVGIQGSTVPPPVPEPGPWALMLAGLVAAGSMASRRTPRS